MTFRKNDLYLFKDMFLSATSGSALSRVFLFVPMMVGPREHSPFCISSLNKFCLVSIYKPAHHHFQSHLSGVHMDMASASYLSAYSLPHDSLAAKMKDLTEAQAE